MNIIAAAIADADVLERERGIAFAAQHLDGATLCELVARGDDAVTRNSAIAALELQGPAALPALERVARGDDDELAMFATQILARIQHHASLQTFVALLQHRDPNVAQAAIEAVGALRAPTAVPELLRLLDADPWLRFAAVEALGRIGDARATLPLIATLHDDLVAEASLDALAQIGDLDALGDVLDLLLDEGRRAFWHAALATIAATLELRGRSAARALRRVAARLGASAALHDLLTDALRGDDARRARAASAVALAIPVRSLLDDVVRRAGAAEDVAWTAEMLERVHPNASAAIVALLGSREPALRVAGLQLVGPRREHAKEVRALLDDAHVGVRAAACMAIGRCADTSVIPVLVARLVATDPAERAAAHHALAAMPGTHLRALRSMLADDGRAESLVTALELLAVTGSRLFAERVRTLTGHRVAPVRRGAVRALAGRTDAASVRMLAARTRDSDTAVALSAIDALANAETAAAESALVALLRSPGALRYHAVLALARFGSDGAAAALEDAFAEAVPHERVEIVAGIARIGASRSATFLRERFAYGDAEVRRAAADGVARTATHDTFALLAAMGTDPDWCVRYSAVHGLARLATPSAYDALERLARDSERVVAATARAACAGMPEGAPR